MILHPTQSLHARFPTPDDGDAFLPPPCGLSPTCQKWRKPIKRLDIKWIILVSRVKDTGIMRPTPLIGFICLDSERSLIRQMLKECSTGL
jgi:hypothetical protein